MISIRIRQANFICDVESSVNIILLTSKFFIFSESFDKNSTKSYMSSFSSNINFNYGRTPIGSKKKVKEQIGCSRLATHVKTSLFVPWSPRQCQPAWGDWVWISSPENRGVFGLFPLLSAPWWSLPRPYQFRYSSSVDKVH